MSAPKDREHFAAHLAREVSPDVLNVEQTTALARRLMRWASSYKRLLVAQLNRPMLESELDRIKSLEAMIGREITALGPGWGVNIGGDPRGCTVKIKVPSGYGNDWSGEGWLCVPGA